MDVLPLTAAIGAEVTGLDLRRPLTGDERMAVNDALIRHLVLFFRGQELSEDEQLAIAGNFGPPVSASVDRSASATPLIFVTLEDTAESPPKADQWHTDVPFVATPPDVARAHDVDDTHTRGGRRHAVRPASRRLRRALGSDAKALLAGLELDLDLGASRETILELYGEDYFRRVVEPFTGARHPLVRIHPRTGRPALYLCGSFMRGIAGMTDGESRALLTFLQSRLEDPNLQCRWRWAQYDVAVWDERCTNHRAVSDHYPNHRLTRRCLAGEGVPIGPTSDGALPVGA